ncbi:MAG: glycosyltransferase family 2 protein [Clostridia bacterium]|nr:glycosyltransferase family 2 protein [Clostridia bacterium]
MVTVLLAVYNGEMYLREQIESILNQTVSDIKIIIRDDGSTDSSAEIIGDYRSKYHDKISVISGEPTGSAMLNFYEMLKSSDDDYIMFADQDDIWYEDKVRITLDKMLQAESENPEKPILVHTDLTVTDGKMNIISDSFFAYQKIFPEDLSINRLLVQNYVTGCTVMINRALKNRALPIPNEAAMHDWWLALTASIFGKIVTIKSPTVYYRQHGNNSVGAKTGGGISFIFRKLKTFGDTKENTSATYCQAEQLLNAYGDIMPEDKRIIVKAYADMRSAGRIKKIKLINGYNFKKCTKLRVLGQYLMG